MGDGSRRHPPPPPTRYPLRPVQSKAAARPAPAPPPTKFGPSGTAQAALAAPRHGTVPPGRPGGPAAPARFTGLPPPKVIQRAEINWKGLDKKPHWAAFYKKYGEILTDDFQSNSSLYEQFVSTLPLAQLDQFVQGFDADTSFSKVADLLALFIKGNKGFKYHPAGAHCGGIRTKFRSFLEKLSVPDVQDITIGGKGRRVIVRTPMMIDPTWGGSRVLDINGKLVNGLAAFETHHAVLVGGKIYDPTGGYFGAQNGWAALLLETSTEQANKRTGTFEKLFRPKTLDGSFKIFTLQANALDELNGIAGAAFFEEFDQSTATWLMNAVDQNAIDQMKELLK